MSPAAALHITVAEHGTEIKALRDQQRDDHAEIRSLKNWIMGTLAAALGGTLMQLFTLLLKK